MVGTLLVGIGLVVVPAVVYRAFAPPFMLRLALQLMGVLGGVLVIIGVAQRFGVHSALVVVTVTLVGYLLRHIIAVGKESVSSLHPSTGGLRSARPHQ